MIKLLILYMSFILLVLVICGYLVYILKIPSPKFVIISIFLVIISPLLVGYLVVFYLLPVPEVTVPDVTWHASTEAVSILKEFGLRGRIAGQNFDKFIPGGRVLLQDPQAKKRVKIGRIVNLIISTGQRKAPVPSLIGRPLSQVNQLLGEAGFQVGATIEVNSEKYQTGIIVGQYPSPEVELGAGSYIDLYIAKNPKYGLIKMPYLIGRKIEKAESMLSDLRLNLDKLKYQETDIIEEGVVMQQSPMWDEDVGVGSQVTLTISKKPKESGQ